MLHLPGATTSTTLTLDFYLIPFSLSKIFLRSSLLQLLLRFLKLCPNEKSITLLLLVACCFYTKAQPITIHSDEVSATSEFLGLSQPLRDLPEVPVTPEMLAAPHVIRDNPSLERPMPSINPNALPLGADPARQQNYTPTNQCDYIIKLGRITGQCRTFRQ